LNFTFIVPASEALAVSWESPWVWVTDCIEISGWLTLL
jgi:hypothetical protein